MISVDEVSKRFGRVRALDQLSLKLGSGVAALLGPNGAGKTTLLRCLATLVQPDRGAIEIGGIRLGSEQTNRSARRLIGYMPQTIAFGPSVTARSQLDRVAVLKDILDRDERRAEVDRVISNFDLIDSAQRNARKLSGGTQRRLGLAQTMLGSPRVLLLDEPTAGLDPEQRTAFRGIIGSAASAGAVVLVSTHQPDDIVAIASTVIVIGNGRVLYQGSPEGLADKATGRVWLVDEAPKAGISWPTPHGRYRVLGSVLNGEPVSPTLEDGYLTLMQFESAR